LKLDCTAGDIHSRKHSTRDRFAPAFFVCFALVFGFMGGHTHPEAISRGQGHAVALACKGIALNENVSRSGKHD
jgi:hypothetical protein